MRTLSRYHYLQHSLIIDYRTEKQELNVETLSTRTALVVENCVFTVTTLKRCRVEQLFAKVDVESDGKMHPAEFQSAFTVLGSPEFIGDKPGLDPNAPSPGPGPETKGLDGPTPAADDLAKLALEMKWFARFVEGGKEYLDKADVGRMMVGATSWLEL
jgi:hypothetical protein